MCGIGCRLAYLNIIMYKSLRTFHWYVILLTMHLNLYKKIIAEEGTGLYLPVAKVTSFLPSNLLTLLFWAGSAMLLLYNTTNFSFYEIYYYYNRN